MLDQAEGLMAPQGEEENPFLQNNVDGAAAEEVKKKNTRFKITAEDVTEGPLGLNLLYIESVVRGGRQNTLKLRGKGHEASDLNKIMNMYKKWHMNFAPKYHFDYFADRMTKMSSDKTVKAHMSKLRQVYRGDEDHLFEFGGEQINLKDFESVQANKGDQPGNQENQVNGTNSSSRARATDKKEGIPYFSYDNNAQAANPKQDPASFRMLD